MISIYFTWLIVAGGLAAYLIRGNYVQAVSWVIFVVLFLWLYVRYFPSVSRYLGYGSVVDAPAQTLGETRCTVTFYTGVGCPFCPLVRSRLLDLQVKMKFTLKEIDVTLKPDLLIAKGIRALPVVEVGSTQWVGNATSLQLADFIVGSSKPFDQVQAMSS